STGEHSAEAPLTHARSKDGQLEQLIRSRTQQSLIVRLARHRYGSVNPQLEAAQLITRAASEAYGLARATLWQLNGEWLEAVAACRRGPGSHACPGARKISPFPRYIEALRSSRASGVENGPEDPRARDLAETFFSPHGVHATLDATIRVGGEV